MTKCLHIKQLICLLVIAIALLDDLFQHIKLIVWKPILEFHQGPHMATIYKGKKQTNKLLLYSSLTNISIAESSTLAFPCTKFERKAAKKFNHGHLFLDFRSWSSLTHLSNNVQLCSAAAQDWPPCWFIWFMEQDRQGGRTRLHRSASASLFRKQRHLDPTQTTP